MLSLNFAIIKDSDMAELVQWGHELMTARQEEMKKSLRHSNITAAFMMIPDYKFEEDKELIVMGTLSAKPTKKLNMRFRINKEYKEITDRLLSPIDYKPENFDWTGASILYFITR